MASKKLPISYRIRFMARRSFFVFFLFSNKEGGGSAPYWNFPIIFFFWNLPLVNIIVIFRLKRGKVIKNGGRNFEKGIDHGRGFKKRVISILYNLSLLWISDRKIRIRKTSYLNFGTSFPLPLHFQGYLFSNWTVFPPKYFSITPHRLHGPE